MQLIADALLEYDGSARASFEHALDNDSLEVTMQAAYGKLRRLPIPLSTAFLTEATARLRELLPVPATAVVPPSLHGNKNPAPIVAGTDRHGPPAKIGPVLCHNNRLRPDSSQRPWGFQPHRLPDCTRRHNRRVRLCLHPGVAG